MREFYGAREIPGRLRLLYEPIALGSVDLPDALRCTSVYVTSKSHQTQQPLNKSQILTLSVWALVILGLVMIYLGGFYGPKVVLPPIVTGIGFFVIAWAFSQLRK
jgi:hypothetical protein